MRMNQQNNATPTVLNGNQVLRRNRVQEITGLSRSTIYARMKNGSFPKPVRLGVRTVGWLAEDINGFLEQCIADSRKTA